MGAWEAQVVSIGAFIGGGIAQEIDCVARSFPVVVVDEKDIVREDAVRWAQEKAQEMPCDGPGTVCVSGGSGGFSTTGGAGASGGVWAGNTKQCAKCSKFVALSSGRTRDSLFLCNPCFGRGRGRVTGGDRGSDGGGDGGGDGGDDGGAHQVCVCVC
jgi:formate-dependent nitrite reductase cytochrome c552 subunit